MVPTQTWYDQLRSTDDGTFTKRNSINPNAEIDYQHESFKESRDDYLRRSIIEKSPDRRIQTPF